MAKNGTINNQPVNNNQNKKGSLNEKQSDCPSDYKAWENVINFPLSGRLSKPRQNGLTMIMDKGLGLYQTRDLLLTAGDYIDFIKLGFGSSALYDFRLLTEKIQLAASYNIAVYPGGTFLEIAYAQNRVSEFLHRSRDLGFTVVEVSDGTVSYSSARRSDLIKRAADLGFTVLTEVGKKDPEQKLLPEQQARIIERDLEDGAYKVIVESRESGKGIGLYNRNGDLIEDDFKELCRFIDIDRLIWEAPLKNQQAELISRLGSNVSLGNIAPTEAIALESLRTGLRSDTFRLTLNI